VPSDKAGEAPALCIDLPAAEPAIERARLAMLAWLAPHGLDERAVNRIEVILEELVSNVVRHSEGATLVTIAADMAGGDFQLTISDDGAPFDPTARDDPKAFTTLEEATPGGLGIAMVRRMSRSFGYKRADGRNRVTVALAAN